METNSKGDIEKVYIGTKIIAAIPMDEHTFLALNGRTSDSENRHGYKVRYEDGYVSWSPKETFERAYREVTRAEVDLIN